MHGMRQFCHESGSGLFIFWAGMKTMQTRRVLNRVISGMRAWILSSFPADKRFGRDSQVECASESPAGLILRVLIYSPTLAPALGERCQVFHVEHSCVLLKCSAWNMLQSDQRTEREFLCFWR